MGWEWGQAVVVAGFLIIAGFSLQLAVVHHKYRPAAHKQRTAG
ncbi:MAG: hypothetical protein KatS3mg110_2192 [Pirellulaceae bacterium]|nr:MAG: hypothetical protein KatS3mg110_2192 [Pirellulaceae bacterium]